MFSKLIFKRIKLLFLLISCSYTLINQILGIQFKLAVAISDL